MTWNCNLISLLVCAKCSLVYFEGICICGYTHTSLFIDKSLHFQSCAADGWTVHKHTQITHTNTHILTRILTHKISYPLQTPKYVTLCRHNNFLSYSDTKISYPVRTQNILPFADTKIFYLMQTQKKSYLMQRQKHLILCRDKKMLSYADTNISYHI